MNYRELFHALSPEAALILGALFVLTLDLTIGRKKVAAARWDASVRVALLAIGLAGCFTFAVGANGPAFGGALMLDPLARAHGQDSLALACFCGVHAARSPGPLLRRIGARRRLVHAPNPSSPQASGSLYSGSSNQNAEPPPSAGR